MRAGHPNPCMQEKLPPRHEDGAFQIYCPTCREPIPQSFFSHVTPERAPENGPSASSCFAWAQTSDERHFDLELAQKIEETSRRHAAVLAKQADVGGIVSPPDYSLPALPQPPHGGERPLSLDCSCNDVLVNPTGRVECCLESALVTAPLLVRGCAAPAALPANCDESSRRGRRPVVANSKNGRNHRSGQKGVLCSNDQVKAGLPRQGLGGRGRRLKDETPVLGS
jgi:hypothetical protein